MDERPKHTPADLEHRLEDATAIATKRDAWILYLEQTVEILRG